MEDNGRWRLDLLAFNTAQEIRGSTHIVRGTAAWFSKTWSQNTTACQHSSGVSAAWDLPLLECLGPGCTGQSWAPPACGLDQTAWAQSDLSSPWNSQTLLSLKFCSIKVRWRATKSLSELEELSQCQSKTNKVRIRARTAKSMSEQDKESQDQS